MEKKFLEGLGIAADVIDKIISENEKDIKSIETQRDTYKGQLDTANTTLKTFEGVDVTDLQGKITTLTTDLANKDKEISEKLAEIEFNGALEKSISALGARNSKTVMALLDINSLKASKNQESDIKSALEAVKKDNSYLFGDVNVPHAVSSTAGPDSSLTDGKTQANQAFRSLFGKE